MDSDFCIVCAEPLQFTAYGPCGHKEACSRCVSRLRSVLKDARCVYCQVPTEAVFVTRFAGDYTQNVGPDAFDGLKARAKAGDLRYLPSAQAYFDDPAHFEEISALCSFTHPLGGAGRVFPSLRALKGHLAQAHKRQLCDICLEGRKVFVAEQIAYSRADLERHQREGDAEGPMAGSAGFKGHPDCRFCKKRFYGENELYQHMHGSHEECFLCRRAAPHRHVYYRDYPDLEAHFKREHHLCEHPACLEAKFVVFPTAQELKTHTAREHGRELSKSERRAALTLPVAFNYRRGEGEPPPASASATNLAAVAAGGRGAVVIGGAASVPAQLGGGARRGSRANLAAAAAAAAAAEGEASVGAGGSSAAAPSGTAPDVGALSLAETDFPSMVTPSTAGPAVGGRWVSGGGGPAGAGGLSSQDFPSLPGTSKAAKRRASKKKSTAEVLGGGGSVRVVNAGAGGAGPSGLAADQFPALGAGMRPLSRGVEELEEEWRPVQRRERSGGGSGLSRPPSSQEVADPAPAPAPAPTRAPRRAPAPAPLPPPAPAPVAAAAPPAAAGGVSAALRAANRDLVAKIKTRLGDGDRFGEFRLRSAAWVKGDITSAAYHAAVAAMGLVSVVPELAATCPDAAKRDELLQVHAGAFQGPPPRGAAPGSWMPPEAAAAAAAAAAAKSSWACSACTLVNAPEAATCEACGVPKPRAELEAGSWWKQRGGAPAPAAPAPAAPAPAPVASTPAGSMSARMATGAASAAPRAAAPAAAPSQPSLSGDMFPSLAPTASGSRPAPSAPANGAGPSGAGASGKKKKGKQSLGEFYHATKAHPQNVWRNPALKGEWASGGARRLAEEERALNDAWAKK